VAARGEPIPADRLTILPATAERWPDIVTLLGGSGERGCWCQAWRGSATGSGSAFGRSEPGANRDALEAQVRRGQFAPGVLAYLDGEVMGWCGLGPRASMPRLMRSKTIPLVDDGSAWSIGCFVVRTGFRRRGVARALLAGAIAYARTMGAPAVEAYPIDPGGSRVSSSFAFVGFTSTFEAAGFRRFLPTSARSAGLPRWLMRLDLRQTREPR
jgi:GNAT superfamily N-acetyltransferase